MTKIFINNKLMIETNRFIGSRYCVINCILESGCKLNAGDIISSLSPNGIENEFRY